MSINFTAAFALEDIDCYSFILFTNRIDDILADSDSELEDDITMDADERSGDGKRNKKRKDDQKYIQEDADEIVDLADINAMSKITCEYILRLCDCEC